MVKGIGTDIVELKRIESAVERHGERFLTYVYSAAERELATARKSQTSFWAGRWAAKEAVYKVLGAKIELGIAWPEIEILRSESGAPYVKLSGRAEKHAEKIGITGLQVSISHCQLYAVAYALGE